MSRNWAIVIVALAVCSTAYAIALHGVGHAYEVAVRFLLIMAADWAVIGGIALVVWIQHRRSETRRLAGGGRR